MATVQNHVRHKKKVATVPYHGRPPNKLWTGYMYPRGPRQKLWIGYMHPRRCSDRLSIGAMYPHRCTHRLSAGNMYPCRCPNLVVREERSHHDHSIPTHNSHNHPTSKYGRPCSGLDWHPGWAICPTTSSLGLNPQSSYFQKLAT